MATYFGEVQELVSRAVEIDESEEQPIYDFIIKTTIANNVGYHCDTLIVCVGDIAKAFSQCYLKSDQPKELLDVKYFTSKVEDHSALYGENIKSRRTRDAAYLYSSDSKIAVCETSLNLPECIYVELFENISNYINCSKVVILTSAPVVTCKGNPFPETPSLVFLPTSSWSGITYPRLQPPNFVSGMAAAILTDYEIKRKPALCVINFVESNFLDYTNVQVFEQLIASNVIQGVVGKNSKAALLDYIKKHFNESNLYI